MPITVDLQEMQSYSQMVLVVVGIILAIFVATIIVVLVKKLCSKPQNINREISIEDRENIKKKYIELLNGLETKCRADKVSNRKAYQELSKITRHYIYETTGVKVHNYTLDEIRSANMTGLYNVVSDCYAPEFSIDKNGDIFNSIAKARKVVEGWN